VLVDGAREPLRVDVVDVVQSSEGAGGGRADDGSGAGEEDIEGGQMG
jgi:hypothetical protein